MYKVSFNKVENFETGLKIIAKSYQIFQIEILIRLQKISWKIGTKSNVLQTQDIPWKKN